MSVIDAIIAKKLCGGGGGGASSADVFIIRATLDESGANAQLDKTTEQIYEAYQGGKYCLVCMEKGLFLPVTSVKTNSARTLVTCSGFGFKSSQGGVYSADLATTDGVTWAINMLSPCLYDVCCEGLQIPGSGGQLYTISVDTNGNLTATLVT